MRGLHFFLFGILVASCLWWFAPHPLPQEQRVHGAGGIPAHKRPAIPNETFITHPPVRVRCDRCTSSWGTWDVCESDKKCMQTPDKVCVPLTANNGSKVLAGHYTGCMCPLTLLSYSDAMITVDIPEDGDSCIVSFCDKRENVCDDGCCRGEYGTKEVCGETMQWYYPANHSSKENSTNSSDAAYRISVCMPDNFTEADKRRHQFCKKGELVGKDCLTPDWEPCCMGPDRVESCQQNCHVYLSAKFTKESVFAESLILVGYLLALCLSFPYFWRFLKWTRLRTGRRLALVIDCKGSEEEGILRTTKLGGEAVAAELRRLGFHCDHLSDRKARRSEVTKKLKELIRLGGEHWCHRPLIVVYFAGHGMWDGRKRSNFLKLHDGWYRLQEAVDMFENMHTAENLHDRGYGRVKHGKVLFVLDCCQVPTDPEDLELGAPSPLRPKIPSQSLAAYYMYETKAKIGCILAARMGKAALDQFDPADEHAPFTAAFLEFMGQHITIRELFAKIDSKLHQVSNGELEPEEENISRSSSPFGRLTLRQRSGGWWCFRDPEDLD